ncbi:MAG: SDR family oxidoreductase [Gemmataceae bacterium]
MKRDLTGKIILITGASSGIGRALAEATAQVGMRVAIAARSADSITELAERLNRAGGTVLAIPADVTKPADRQRLLAAVVERYGGLDILLNNAGIGTQGHFAYSSEEILRRIMETNFFAPSELIRLAIPILEKGRQPAIVNVTSMCGRRAMPAWPEYSASKHAIIGLSEALRAELVRYGIDVLVVVPGLTNTNLDKHLLRQDGRMVIDYRKGMKPERVAQNILTIMRRNQSETVLGREARAVLWTNRLWPRLVDYLLARFVRRLYARLAAQEARQKELVDAAVTSPPPPDGD